MVTDWDYIIRMIHLSIIAQREIRVLCYIMSLTLVIVYNDWCISTFSLWLYYTWNLYFVTFFLSFKIIFSGHVHSFFRMKSIFDQTLCIEIPGILKEHLRKNNYFSSFNFKAPSTFLFHMGWWRFMVGCKPWNISQDTFLG